MPRHRARCYDPEEGTLDCCCELSEFEEIVDPPDEGEIVELMEDWPDD